jgi:hypothetical protein
MPVAPIKFIIENKTFTSVLLAKELNCSSSTALRRLKSCNTLNELRTPVRV